MMLFGKANWWFPAWLDRILPKLSVDADDLDTSKMPEDPGPEPQPELAGTLKLAAAGRPTPRRGRILGSPTQRATVAGPCSYQA